MPVSKKQVNDKPKHHVMKDKNRPSIYVEQAEPPQAASIFTTNAAG